MVDDPYELEAIANYIKRPMLFVSGTLLKVLMGLGDRVAGCLLIVIPEGRLTDPEIANRVSVAISHAFASPARIRCAGDKIPQLSIFVLEQMLAGTPDAAARARIGETLVNLKDIARRHAASTKD